MDTLYMWDKADYYVGTCGKSWAIINENVHHNTLEISGHGIE